MPLGRMAVPSGAARRGMVVMSSRIPDPLEEGAADEGDPGRYRVPALERGLDILELLSASEGGSTRAALADAMGVSVSQIFRMLDCLQRRMYISLDPRNNHFALTSKLFEVAHRHPPTRRLIALAIPIMRGAAMRARQSIHLSVYDDGQQLVIAQVDALEDSGYFVKPGTRRDIYLTASGRVLLAFQPDEERAAMLAAAKAKTTELMPEADLLRHLEIIRLRGFEEMPSLQIAGIHNFCFPVMDVSGKAVATMTMPFLFRTDLVSRMDEARDALGLAAAELSRLLGYVRKAP
jgi:DNA-binding IclR family transcriptional regulator